MASRNAPSGASIVTAARSFLGIPYLYGGTNPAVGLDCSGLVLNVARKAGIGGCPRTSEEQFAWGVPVSQPAPGDLVFFVGDPIDPPPGHVGIVVTPGRMIDAPFSGTTVRYDSYGTNGTGVNKLMGYRRMPGSTVSTTANPNVGPPGPNSGQNPGRAMATFAGGVIGFVLTAGIVILAVIAFAVAVYIGTRSMR